MKQVIHIYGASGSGTSTLGRAIGETLGFTWLDSDNYFWLPTNPPYTAKRGIAERLNAMNRDIDAAENVVLSGSLTDWGDALMPRFTLAVRVETDTPTRLARIREREYRKFGERILPGGDMYETHMNFLKWAAGYDDGGLNTRSRAKHDAWESMLQCPILRVDGTDEIGRNVEKVRRALEKMRKTE